MNLQVNNELKAHLDHSLVTIESLKSRIRIPQGSSVTTSKNAFSERENNLSDTQNKFSSLLPRCDHHGAYAQRQEVGRSPVGMLHLRPSLDAGAVMLDISVCDQCKDCPAAGARW